MTKAKAKSKPEVKAEESALTHNDPVTIVDNSPQVMKEKPKKAQAKRVLVLKNVVISMTMPGRTSGTVTRTFKEGQMVYDSEAIELLIGQDAPIEILS